jgi:hypothetical protein
MKSRFNEVRQLFRKIGCASTVAGVAATTTLGRRRSTHTRFSEIAV